MSYLSRAYFATYAAALEVVVMVAETRDFTKAADPPSFKLDGDTFVGRKKLNGGAAMKFASLTANIDDDSDDVDPEEIGLMLKRLFRLTLRTSSYKRMAARIDTTLGARSQSMIDQLDPDDLPDDEIDEEFDDDLLDLTQLNEIGSWLLEQYGLRPTEPASPSSGGQESQDVGTNLTEKL
jgi:hypothetical protein